MNERCSPRVTDRPHLDSDSNYLIAVFTSKEFSVHFLASGNINKQIVMCVSLVRQMEKQVLRSSWCVLSCLVLSQCEIGIPSFRTSVRCRYQIRGIKTLKSLSLHSEELNWWSVLPQYLIVKPPIFSNLSMALSRNMKRIQYYRGVCVT
jgi:hypothetical protein